MNTQQADVDRALRHWFEDGPSVLPDRTVEAIAARIARQPQLRTWRSPGRLFVNTYAKLVAAAAAVLIVGFIGWQLLPGRGSIGGQPTAAPTATAQPTTAPTAPVTAPPSASATFQFPASGLLPAGDNATANFTPAFTFTVPEGWIKLDDVAGAPGSLGFYSLFRDTPANRAEFEKTGNAANSLTIVKNLTNPWFACDAWEDNRGATAAEMATAVAANEALVTTEAVDVSIGGLTGKQLDVWVDPAWTETCPGDPAGTDLRDMRTRGIFLDAPGNGVLVVFVGTLRAADFEPFLAEAMPILQSIDFTE